MFDIIGNILVNGHHIFFNMLYIIWSVMSGILRFSSIMKKTLCPFVLSSKESCHNEDITSHAGSRKDGHRRLKNWLLPINMLSSLTICFVTCVVEAVPCIYDWVVCSKTSGFSVCPFAIKNSTDWGTEKWPAWPGFWTIHTIHIYITLPRFMYNTNIAVSKGTWKSLGEANPPYWVFLCISPVALWTCRSFTTPPHWITPAKPAASTSWCTPPLLNVPDPSPRHPIGSGYHLLLHWRVDKLTRHPLIMIYLHFINTKTSAASHIRASGVAARESCDFSLTRKPRLLYNLEVLERRNQLPSTEHSIPGKSWQLEYGEGRGSGNSA